MIDLHNMFALTFPKTVNRTIFMKKVFNFRVSWQYIKQLK